MRLTVHPRCGLSIGGINKAEDLPRLLIDPIPFLVHSVLGLRLQISLMCARYVARRDTAVHCVHV